ncbi:MAG: type I-U CRISPR-associated RAMP protein Csb1/Cas7u [Bryobacterales bacterium]|nr:type I-U CRISPR-associated RAMP protein Csb1/Cas7u [Bryobacterales bacterium]
MPELTFLKALEEANRLLLTVRLRPVQGDRFQPTGFPSLGAATYQTKDGVKLLVESAQSMANRLEMTCWDDGAQAPVTALQGISHVTVNRRGVFLTDSMLEAHRINSPYLLAGKDRAFFNKLKADLGRLEEGPIDRKKLTEALFRYDVSSLIHGVFLEKIAGRLRVARSLSAFIEAVGVSVAASGGVKNDHVNPSGVTKDGFGNVPFSRDEFVAKQIECYFNLDLAQIRGYSLSEEATEMLILLGLYRIRKLLDGDLRLRTACDLEVDDEVADRVRPAGFALPSLKELEVAVRSAIDRCQGAMEHTTVTFEDELKREKKPKRDEKDIGSGDQNDDESGEESGEESGDDADDASGS